MEKNLAILNIDGDDYDDEVIKRKRVIKTCRVTYNPKWQNRHPFSSRPRSLEIPIFKEQYMIFELLKKIFFLTARSSPRKSKEKRHPRLVDG